MSTKKRGLGKGLSALISDKVTVENFLSEEQSSEKIELLNLDLVIPRQDQPRKYFDEELIKELASSISVHGVIQPIIVRKLDDKYEIIAGERRYRASKSLNLKEIPAIVRAIDEENAAKISLIENVQREDLNPIEEALAYKKIMEDYELKQDELGQAVGKSRAYISNSIRLLNLDKKVVDYLYDGKLTPGHGKALLALEADKQLEAAERIINLGLNVRDTEEEVKKSKSKSKKKKTNGHNKVDSYMKDLEDNLMRSLGTKVSLQIGKNKGKIEIEYYGEEDLERLIDLLTK